MLSRLASHRCRSLVHALEKDQALHSPGTLVITQLRQLAQAQEEPAEEAQEGT